jgi:hypothetical protein
MDAVENAVENIFDSFTKDVKKDIKDKKEKKESEAQVQKRIANNYPSSKSKFYTIFEGAHINDVRKVESAVRALGIALYNRGVLPLWDDVNVNINYKSIEVKPQEDELMRYSYVNYRNNRALKSGAYIVMNVTTPINGKESESIEFAFNMKNDFRQLAYVATKMFLYALGNFLYNENKIAFIEFKIEKQLAELTKLLK